MAAALRESGVTWQIFYGAEDIEVVNVETAGANTIFQLNTTFYECWNRADPTTFPGHVSGFHWNTTDAWAETWSGTYVPGTYVSPGDVPGRGQRVVSRRRHQRGRRRVGGVGRVVVGERGRGEGARGGGGVGVAVVGERGRGGGG